jgi:hypothetical protein
VVLTFCTNALQSSYDLFTGAYILYQFDKGTEGGTGPWRLLFVLLALCLTYILFIGIYILY